MPFVFRAVINRNVAGEWELAYFILVNVTQTALNHFYSCNSVSMILYVTQTLKHFYSCNSVSMIQAA
jgi:hypothetical protein